MSGGIGQTVGGLATMITRPHLWFSTINVLFILYKQVQPKHSPIKYISRMAVHFINKTKIAQINVQFCPESITLT